MLCSVVNTVSSHVFREEQKAGEDEDNVVGLGGTPLIKLLESIIPDES